MSDARLDAVEVNEAVKLMVGTMILGRFSTAVVITACFEVAIKLMTIKGAPDEYIKAVFDVALADVSGDLEKQKKAVLEHKDIFDKYGAHTEAAIAKIKAHADAKRDFIPEDSLTAEQQIAVLRKQMGMC